LAIPAALTPTEIYTAIQAGARAVKLFPACSLGWQGLEAVKSLGPYKKVFVLVSGGIVPEDIQKWLRAGADAIAVGTKLVGQDTKLYAPPLSLEQGDPLQEEIHWRKNGSRATADFLSNIRRDGLKRDQDSLT